MPVASAGLMRRALQYASTTGRLLALHCEEPTLSKNAHVHEGRVAANRLELGVGRDRRVELVLPPPRDDDLVVRGQLGREREADAAATARDQDRVASELHMSLPSSPSVV